MVNKLEFIQALRQLIADGATDDALSLMRKDIVDFDSSLLTSVTLLENRYNNAFTDFTIKGILPRQDYDRTVAQINYALLEILEKLEKSAPLSTSTVKNKNSGRILHNIPGMMPMAKEQRCIVRIAYDDAILLQDLDKIENISVQNIRIAEVMTVELLDFNETPAFAVRTITGQEQFVSTDDYTQWIFMIKALREGKYPLTLKVAVIEEVNGKERKREIVLEKEVFIVGNIEQPVAPVSDVIPTRDAAFQSSETYFEDTTVRFNYVSDNDSPPVPPLTLSKRFSISTVMSTVAVIAMAMSGIITYKKFVYDKKHEIITVGDTSQQNAANAANKGNNKPNKQDIDSSSQLSNQGRTPASTIEIQKDTIKTTVPQQPNIVRPTNITPKNTASQPTSKPPVKVIKKPNTPKKTSSKVKPRVVKPSDEPITYVEQPTIEAQTQPDTLVKTPPKAPEIKSYRVRLILKGEMKKAQISVDGEPVDNFLQKNIWGTPQYIEFKSSKERHTITFTRGAVSCSVENILIENGDLTVVPCSFD